MRMTSAEEAVHLVVDNAAVAFVVRSGFSKTQLGDAIMSEHADLWRRVVGVSLVVSADNPADSGSRGLDVDPARVERMFRALASEGRGVLWGSTRKAGPSAQAGWRHEEPDDDGFLGPEDEDE